MVLWSTKKHFSGIGLHDGSTCLTGLGRSLPIKGETQSSVSGGYRKAQINKVKSK